MGAFGWLLLIWLLLVALLAAWYVAYTLWYRKACTRATANSETIETRLGAIEYRQLGGGPVLLHFHAMGGGHDSRSQLEHLIDSGYTLLTPDRPGYWGTPLVSGGSPDAEAEIAAALLDTLGIERVAVIGIAAGGPGAIAFAAMNPDRCAALVLISAVTRATPVLNPDGMAHSRQIAVKPRQVNMSAYDAERMLRWRPKRTVRRLVSTYATYDVPAAENLADMILADAGQMQALQTNFAESSPMAQRYPGLVNDLEMTQNLPPLPLDQVQTPTLIIASRYDRFLGYESAVSAHEQIADSELMTVDQAGHLVWLGDSKVTRQIEERIEGFLRTHFA